MAQQIQIRRGTAADAALTNPVLAEGEQGYETDTGVVKIGDGTTAWTALPVAFTVGDSPAFAPLVDAIVFPGQTLGPGTGAPTVSTLSARTGLGFSDSATNNAVAMIPEGAFPSHWATYDIEIGVCETGTAGGNVLWRATTKATAAGTTYSGGTDAPDVVQTLSGVNNRKSVVMVAENLTVPTASQDLGVRLARLGGDVLDTSTESVVVTWLRLSRAS